MGSRGIEGALAGLVGRLELLPEGGFRRVGTGQERWRVVLVAGSAAARTPLLATGSVESASGHIVP
jgi:hypothetical protein